mmetsp:Transcript_35361/g.77351  ORF Transcript_35361/g.77351 Transcript_35361/m.77351 type:complete len:317 (-) Transcript_35361:150-1100(-)
MSLTEAAASDTSTEMASCSQRGAYSDAVSVWICTSSRTWDTTFSCPKPAARSSLFSWPSSSKPCRCKEPRPSSRRDSRAALVVTPLEVTCMLKFTSKSPKLTSTTGNRESSALTWLARSATSAWTTRTGGKVPQSTAGTTGCGSLGCRGFSRRGSSFMAKWPSAREPWPSMMGTRSSQATFGISLSTRSSMKLWKASSRVSSSGIVPPLKSRFTTSALRAHRETRTGPSGRGLVGAIIDTNSSTKMPSSKTPWIMSNSTIMVPALRSRRQCMLTFEALYKSSGNAGFLVRSRASVNSSSIPVQLPPSRTTPPTGFG